jgi:hypothetical protein
MSRILPIELKEFDATTTSGALQNFGAPLKNPAIKINVFNTGNTDVYISYSGVPTGVPQKLRIPAGGVLTFDESTLYFRGTDQEFYFPKGAQLQLQQVTGPSTAGGFIIAHVVTRVLQ